MVELEAGSPVGSPQQRLQGTGQVHKHVAHQEKPARHTQAQKLNLAQSSFVLQHKSEYNRVVSLHAVHGVGCLIICHIHWLFVCITKAERLAALLCDELNPEPIKFGICIV